MKSFAGFKIILPLFIALSLMLAPPFAHRAMGDDGAKAKASGTEGGSKRENPRTSEEGELEFKNVEPATDPFFVDEFYDAVKMQRLQENVSGGVTSDGLKLRFDW
jgi:hypothetical protein